MSLSVMLVDSSGLAPYALIPTSPGPILIADFEGNAHKFPGKVDRWLSADVESGKFPTVTDGSIVATVVENYTQFKALTTSLHSPKSPFKSFWIVSATVLTQMGEVEIARKKTNTQQGFGELLNFLRPELTAIKQLAARADMTLEVFGATAWVRDDRPAPAMQGSISSWFTNMFDVVGYPSVEVIDGKLAYRVKIMPAPNGGDPKAKGTAHMLLTYGESILNPNFTELNQEI